MRVSICVSIRGAGEHGADHDPEIERERPIVDVVEVVLDTAAHRAFAEELLEEWVDRLAHDAVRVDVNDRGRSLCHDRRIGELDLCLGLRHGSILRERRGRAANQKRRQDFPTAFSKLGVDLVLQGHDHSYSRSYVIKNGKKAHNDEQPGAADVSQGPGGVIYVTANSASGSKYYDLTDPDTTADPNYGPDPLNPDNHWANSVENQEHVRTYVKVEVRKNQLVVENVRSGTCAAPNAAVELGKVSWCGPDSGASAAQPVGSTVDKVVIHPYRFRSTWWGGHLRVVTPPARISVPSRNCPRIIRCNRPDRV